MGPSNCKRSWDIKVSLYPVRKGNGFCPSISAWSWFKLNKEGMGRKNRRYNPESPWEATRVISIQFGVGASIALASLSFIHSKLGFTGLTNYFLYLYRQQNELLYFPQTHLIKNTRTFLLLRIPCSVLAQCDLCLQTSAPVMNIT